MPSQSGFESLTPLVQIFVLGASAVIGGLAWMFGAKSQPGAADGGSSSNLIELSSEKLRNDLTTVLAKHRDAIDLRILRQGDDFKLGFDRFNDKLTEHTDRIDDRMREVEISLARIEAREESKKK